MEHIADKAESNNSIMELPNTPESVNPANLQTISMEGVSPLVQMFASGKVPIEQMQKLMDLQERHEANEAKKAYHEALAKAKAEMPVAHKSGKNTHLKSTYATLDDLLSVANPCLAKFGLSVSWDIGEQTAESITTTCRISHQLGHSEASAPVTMPITKGNNAVSPAQSVGIAMTYARRYSFTAILGIATTEDDNDANPPPAEPKELPEYPADRFKANYPKWQKSVEDGAGKPSAIVTELQSRFVLSAKQIKDINALADCAPLK